jgi:hypothetical protein
LSRRSPDFQFQSAAIENKFAATKPESGAGGGAGAHGLLHYLTLLML